MRELLYKMLKTPSPSGSELAIQKMIINEMKNVSDTVITHHNFNVINVINPESPTKILLCGHVDEVGLYIEKVLNDGTCRLARAGGVRPQVYIGQHVRVITQSGKEVYGVIGYTPNMEKLKVTDLLLDLGTTSKEDTLKLIEIGDPVVHITDYTELNNNCLAGRALDDKLGAYIILETLRKVKEQGTKLGVYASTTVGEETTGRGAKMAAQVVNPTIAIAIDVSYATDINYLDGLTGDTSLGKGPILTRGSLMNPKIHELMLASAKRLGLNIQMDIATSRSYTDADSVYDMHDGIPTYLVSIPLRYMHSSAEVCSMKDVDEIIALLVDFIMNFDPNTDFDPFK
ncbi:MAG: M20/M25/M40 family metallo-hydrolase [Bacilli bacterium]|nr:M20/M25/M40 family metallo-hydrolase [Mollicutes bacterium]MDY3899227.1 M20/M25/M40 family metallo-hydrolase [Bacilli bacterium]